MENLISSVKIIATILISILYLITDQCKNHDT